MGSGECDEFSNFGDFGHCGVIFCGFAVVLLARRGVFWRKSGEIQGEQVYEVLDGDKRVESGDKYDNRGKIFALHVHHHRNKAISSDIHSNRQSVLLKIPKLSMFNYKHIALDFVRRGNR